jgi:hypothetical protein
LPFSKGVAYGLLHILNATIDFQQSILSLSL